MFYPKSQKVLLLASMLALSGSVLVFPSKSNAQSQRAGVWDARSSASSSSRSSASAGPANASPGQYTYVRESSRITRGVLPQSAINPYGQAGRQPQPNHDPRYQNAQQQAAQSGANATQKSRPQDYKETLPGGRRFTVHLPASYDPRNPMPVVLVFHGLGMNGSSVAALSAMDLTAEKYGFITVYPDAISGRWNDGVQPQAATDDVGFVSDLLNYLPRKYRIDTRRVYACGISNGGFFVQRLACEIGNRIAAIGVVAASGSYNVCSSCSLRRGMPVVFFLGTDDPLIPRDGETKELGQLGEALGLGNLGSKAKINSTIAKFGGVMSADDATEFWAKNNSCSAHPRRENLADRDTRDGCKAIKETYSGGAGGADVVVYTIEGGGHSWPGGLGFVAKDIIGRTCNDISANEIMWQFFQYKSR